MLFLALFLCLLEKGGRCACIVPDGMLFGSSKAHKSIRKELIESHQLKAVISMPSGVFKPYAGVSTAVLVFVKTNAGGTENVWFYDMKGSTMKYITKPRFDNLLFLADRTALVKQAKDDFKNYLPDMSLCNLFSNKDDRNARIVFPTYPTILNAIDNTKTKDGVPLFSPAHFDLIITDESHRSIFKEYRAIFEYFDAITVGLTATPKTDVDRNTYDFFEVENGVPTYAYDYETAVYTDHVLVPYYNYEVRTKFLEEGITYDDLSEEDKARNEDDFAEDGYVPDFIPSAQLNKFVFNEKPFCKTLWNAVSRQRALTGSVRPLFLPKTKITLNL